MAIVKVQGFPSLDLPGDFPEAVDATVETLTMQDAERGFCSTQLRRTYVRVAGSER
jgi:hypothetical protein